MFNKDLNIVSSAACCGKPQPTRPVGNSHRSHREQKESFMLSHRSSISRGSLLVITALAAVAAGTSMVARVSASPVLLADYKAVNYNATTGVWTDSSGNGDNATVGTGVTAPTLVTNATPNGSSAVNFAADSEYLNITTGLPAGSGYTVLAFAEPTATTVNGTYAIVGGGPGALEYRIQTLNGGNVQVLLDTDITAFGASNTAVSNNSFSMIGVATDNTGNATFYLNGSADGTTTGSNAFNSAVNLIGASDTGANASPNEFFIGNIAELQIYSGVMTSSQIQTVNESFTSAYVNPVPEPTTLGLIAIGGAGLLLMGRKRTTHWIA